MGNITGQVRDKNGNPIEGATVLITDDSPEHKDIAALTNDDGEYCFDDLFGGEYTILVSTEQGAQCKQKVEVNTGKTSRLDFTF